MDDLIGWLRQQLDDDERVARAAIPAMSDSGEWKIGPIIGSIATTIRDHNDNTVHDGGVFRIQDGEHIARWDPARVLAEVEAKRRRLDWLLSLQHDMGEEDFPTYSSCRILVEPGLLGDLEVGYCSCGLDARRLQLFKFEVVPYAERDGYRDEWRP